MLRTLQISVLAVAVIGFCSTSFAQDKLGKGSYAQRTSGSSNTSSSGSNFSVSNNDRIAKVQGQNTSLVQQSQTTASPKSSDPETHTVVSGDTLWDLSARYMSDPLMWPALWSYNPQVTNPHWIYPGDTIYLGPQSDNAISIAPPIESPKFKSTSAKSRGMIMVPGIYLSKLPETRGHILFSDQEKNMITANDDVQVDWVDIEMRKKVSVGQKFTIFSESKPVRNEDGDPMAYKLIRLGSLEIIDHHTDTLSTARITQASREISRGDIIIPNEDLVYKFDRATNTKSMEGRIIDSIDIITQISAEQYVIINRGTEDGVAQGNRWVIFEQREGLNLLEKGEDTQTQYTEEKKKSKDDDDNKDPRDGEIERDDEQSWVLGRPPQAPVFPEQDNLDDIYGDREYTTNDLPLRKIGEVVVVDVQDKFCTGIISNSTREVGIDTRVVMIKGY